MATMSARYTVIDGEVVAQERGGVRHQLVPDPLGSTVALYDNAGTKTDTFGYWPYGESTGRTGTTTIPFQYVGSRGYYSGKYSIYVKRRNFNCSINAWISEDILNSNESLVNLYLYSLSNPVTYMDLNGLYPQNQKSNIKHPCQQRTESYCEGTRKNRCEKRAENCFCTVSKLICQNVILNEKNFPHPVREKTDCINKCMFDNWKKQGGGFPIANDACRQHGNDTFRCCKAQIRAEQNGLTYCRDVVCKKLPGLLPDLQVLDPNAQQEQRINVGILACCKGRLGEPLRPGFPENDWR